MASSTKMSLKLIIDKKEERVLFAEAGKDFIDFLFSLLTLPISSLLGFLDDNIFLEGGLPKLYQSVKDLDKKYINPNHEKDVILKPKCLLPYVSRHSLLPLNEQQPTIIYKCMRTGCNNKLISVVPNQGCPTCRSMIVEDGGFVNETVTYMVMDDLVVSPMSTISTSIACLNKHNIKDVGALEEKVVYVGTDEAIKLLKNALTSKTVLTNVFLGEGREGNKPSKRVKTEDNN